MTTTLIVPPVELAVSLSLAKEALRIEADNTSLDASITGWISAITSQAEHDTNRAFILQDWRVALDGFPDAINLERAPIVGVVMLQYYDGTNTLQLLDAADYYVDNITEPGYIVPAGGKSWPATFSRRNAVIGTYRAGYGLTHAGVPDVVKMYIIAKLTEQFDPTDGVRPVKSALDRLLDREMVYV